tara:strand:- start:60618 stop:60899 length:282 start_codon:yes stop_codon:yes gene_type:complete
MGYWDLVEANKHDIIIKCKVVIDNENLSKSFFISTNLHCDFGICNEMFNSYSGKSKREYRKRIARYKQITNKKVLLVGTDNDSTYTRLIYEFS